MLNPDLRNILRPLLIIASVISLIFALNYSGAFYELENMSQDWRMEKIRADKSVSPQIAVIMIDDASLAAMDSYAGRWPWPRYVYADLLDFMSQAQPKGVLFDVTFTEKQSFNAKAGETINEGDSELVESSTNYPFVYHAIRLVHEKLAKDENAKIKLGKPLPSGFAKRFSISQRQIHGNNTKTLVSGLKAPGNNNYYLPFPELSKVTPGIGVVEVQADKDSVYRRARLFHNYQHQYYPALSISAILDQLHVSHISRDKNTLHLDQLKIPVDKDEKVRVNFYGHYNTYSFSGIIASLQAIENGDPQHVLIDPAEFKDKYVFVGGSAAGLNDLKHTPIDSRLPGVLLHASLASNILTRDFLSPPNSLYTYLFVVLFAIISTISVLFVKKPILKNLIPLSSGLGYAVTGYYFFAHNVIIELVAPLSSLILAWLAAFSALVLMEGREKRKFKKMMSQYLSPAVLNTVVSNHSDYACAEIGSKENISILFSDIRNFTNMSEKLPAESVVEILNYYFSSMTDSIFSYEGTIDKFIGDAIMAFWGAPIKINEHAEKAVYSAIDMIRRMEKVNEWIMAKGLNPIAIGIGIHTGDAILGNIGSENKLDYTIIGDNVNLASRIEGLTKHYGASILISEDTYRALTSPMPCFIADLVRVKGKEKPIKVYQPLILRENPSEEELQTAWSLATLNSEMFQHYTNCGWSQALQCLEALPNDKLHASYKDRCLHYLHNPPAHNWDGVHTMSSK